MYVCKYTLHFHTCLVNKMGIEFNANAFVSGYSTTTVKGMKCETLSARESTKILSYVTSCVTNTKRYIWYNSFKHLLIQKNIKWMLLKK